MKAFRENPCSSVATNPDPELEMQEPEGWWVTVLEFAFCYGWIVLAGLAGLVGGICLAAALIF